MLEMIAPTASVQISLLVFIIIMNPENGHVHATLITSIHHNNKQTVLY